MTVLTYYKLLLCSYENPQHSFLLLFYVILFEQKFAYILDSVVDSILWVDIAHDNVFFLEAIHFLASLGPPVTTHTLLFSYGQYCLMMNFTQWLVPLFIYHKLCFKFIFSFYFRRKHGFADQRDHIHPCLCITLLDASTFYCNGKLLRWM